MSDSIGEYYDRQDKLARALNVLLVALDAYILLVGDKDEVLNKFRRIVAERLEYARYVGD